MKNPKISVIVPVYKVEPYLRICLDSIMNQTYRNLEIILIDDGSPDNCGAISDEYAVRDSRFQVVHQENRGLSAARNAGLELSTGDYISFVDSDDVISPIFIQCLLSAGADVAQCGYTAELKNLEADAPARFERLNGIEMSERLCMEGSIANTVVWSKLWSRVCFESLRFPEGRIHEDEFITWKIFWQADNIARTETPLYYYRQRQGSIVNNMFSVQSLDRLDAMRERIGFYENVGAVKLADLSKAAFCYTLRGMWEEISRFLPRQAPGLAKELKHIYKEVMKSKEIGVRKKAALTLQAISPQAYSAVKNGRK